MTTEADNFLLNTQRGCFPHTERVIFPVLFSHSFAELRINRRRRCLLAQNEEWELNFSVALSEGLDTADTQAHVPTHTEETGGREDPEHRREKGQRTSAHACLGIKRKKMKDGDWDEAWCWGHYNEPANLLTPPPKHPGG